MKFTIKKDILLDALLNLSNDEWINNEEQKDKFISNLYDCKNYLNDEYFKKTEDYLKNI